MRRPRNTTPALVEEAAERWPDAEAVVDGDVRLTFAQLLGEVGRVRGAALAAGIHKGDRAAIWAPNSHLWVVAALGLHAAGAVLVPLNTRYKGEEAAYILARSGARMLFTVRGFLGVDYPRLLVGHETGVERTVVFGESSWFDYLAETTARRPTVDDDDLSDILFTSGTTGRPKGVMSSHGQTVQVCRDWCSIVGLRSGDRYLMASPFSHTAGYKAGLVAAVSAGATVIPVPLAEVQPVMELVSHERVTVFPGVPTLFQLMLDHPDRQRYDLSSLRLSAVGGASVPVHLVERMRSELFSTVVTGYGLTETSGVVCMATPRDPPEVIARTVGRALPNVEVRVVDAENRPVDVGTAGEVVVRGHNVMKGYFDAPEETAATIDGDGWLHTGDIGFLDADGNLTITDRLKDMFVVGGFNAYPAEIEATLARHPDVAMASVIGIPDQRMGEVGMAYVVPKPGRSPTEGSIIAWAREAMANYKVPRKIAIVDTLPTTASGKVVKDELRNWAARLRDPALTQP